MKGCAAAILCLVAGFPAPGQDVYDFLPDPAGHAGAIPVARDTIIRYIEARSPETQPDREALHQLLADPSGKWRQTWQLLELLDRGDIAVTPEATQARLADPAFSAMVGDIMPAAPPAPEELAQLAGNRDIQLQLGILAWGYAHCADAPACSDEAIESFYRRNQHLFLIPEHRSLKLLVIDRRNDDADDRRETVAARLRQGEPFSRLLAEFDGTVTDEIRDAALQDPAVRRAMRDLPPDDPEAVSELITTPVFYVWGQAEVFPAHYIPLDDGLRNRLRCRLIEHEALRRLTAAADRDPDFRAPFRWEF